MSFVDTLLWSFGTVVTCVAFIGLIVKGTRWAYLKFVQKTTERDIEHALKIKSELESQLPWIIEFTNRGEAIIRNVADSDSYPNTDTPQMRISNWFKVEIKGLYYNGLEVHISMPRRLAIDPVSSAWREVATGDEDEWNTVLAYEVGRIPYRFIRALDWHGDEYYDFLHVFCDFKGLYRTPYESHVYYYRPFDDARFLEPIEGYLPWVERLRFWQRQWHRIRVFLNI